MPWWSKPTAGSAGTFDAAAWEWPDHITASALNGMAQVCLPLLREPERWIHRRVEKIYFKDCHTARHQVSVDFTLPEGISPVSTFDDRDIYVAPLFMLLKSPPEPLRLGRQPRKHFLILGRRQPDRSREPVPTASISDLDFVDQTGRRQPLLTRRQSRLLSSVILLEAARRALGRPLSRDLRDRIMTIPVLSRSALAGTLDYLFDERACRWDPRRRLQRDAAFTELAYSFASHSLIVSLFAGRPDRRTILKLSYDEPVNEQADRGRWRPLRSLGWRSERFSVLLNEVGASSSYHVEIAVPPELEVNAVGLVGVRYCHFGKDLNALPDKDKDYFIQQIDKTNSGEIYVPEPLPGRRVGKAWVKLRARRPGFLVGALVASCITTVVLFLAAIVAPEIIHDAKSEAAVVALLLVPTLLAAYIARPGEHAIASKMLRVARFALVADAALLFAAVLFLFIVPDDSAVVHPVTVTIFGHMITVVRRGADPGVWLQGWWYWLTAISLVGAGLFVVSNVLPLPHGKTVYKPPPSDSEV